MKRVGFLFNHDAAHQIAHSAPAAFALSERHPDIEVVLYTTCEEEKAAVCAFGTEFEKARCRHERLSVPRSAQILDRLTGRAFLLKRIGTLWHHRALFKSLDAVVVPEKTSLLLKRWLGDECPKLVHTRHGAGDRANGFNPATAKFDYHLLPGRKHEARMKALGQLHDGRYAIVGYPKLDRATHRSHAALFENGRKTVLYAPHFDPAHSSWYDWGPAILEFFAASRDYNLIFAPHVMLFRRRWQFSIEGRYPRRPPPIPEAARQARHIHIDTGSPALFDMTYLRVGDIYMGDVSSQVYEFLVEPRPCVFLNPNRVDWIGNDNYRFWHTGPVVDDIDGLPEALDNAQRCHATYRPIQEKAFTETFDLTQIPSCIRAAEAIAAFVNERE